jgi:hypothetical protein
MGIFARCAFAATLVLFGSGSLSAQGIRGVVLDSETDLPVGAAAVSLLDAGEEEVRRVLADSAGAFSIPVLHRGRYHLRAERIGYVTVVSQPIDLLAGDTMVVELRMGVDAVLLAPLTVTASSRTVLRNHALNGFYDRQRRGRGTFYDPTEIERFRPASVINLLQVTPGVRIRYGRGARTQVRMNAMGGRSRECIPEVYVDGTRALPDELESWVSGSSIRALEVYRRPLAVPVEYMSVRNWDCGAILIWTSFTVDR